MGSLQQRMKCKYFLITIKRHLTEECFAIINFPYTFKIINIHHYKGREVGWTPVVLQAEEEPLVVLSLNLAKSSLNSFAVGLSSSCDVFTQEMGLSKVVVPEMGHDYRE